MLDKETAHNILASFLEAKSSLKNMTEIPDRFMGPCSVSLLGRLFGVVPSWPFWGVVLFGFGGSGLVAWVVLFLLFSFSPSWADRQIVTFSPLHALTRSFALAVVGHLLNPLILM